MSFKFVDGGVCAAKGFKASGIWCGIRANRTKRDLALIVSEAPCAAAAIYTQNKVKGAPILVTQEHLENGTAQAVLCNSGNANTCNADGEFIAHAMCESAANALKLSEDDFIIASTGVIGRPLPLEPITKAMPSLVSALRADGGTEAAEAIMTTDTLRKEVAVSFDLEGRVCTVGGIAKGSGMIHPNMATMLCFVTSDTAISPEMLRKACKVVADETFNMISVDGDTSTNDMMSVMANGLADRERERRVLQICAGADHGLPPACKTDCRGWRRRNQTARVHSIGRARQGDRQKGREIGGLFQPAESGDVWRGRQLGTGALRDRLYRCGF